MSDKEGKQLETPAIRGRLSWLLSSIIVPVIIGLVVPAMMYEKSVTAEVNREEVETSAIFDQKM